MLTAFLVAGCGGKSSTEQSVAPSQAQLNISIQGPGLVRGDGFDCHGSCSRPYTVGTRLRLEAIPDPGMTFAGWSGACSGTAPCDLKIDADRTVAAKFETPPPPPPGKARLTVAVDGHGSVRSAPAGIDCGGACSATFDVGTSVALAATPDDGWTFSGWSDGCVGSGGCALTLNGDVRVSAKFNPPPPPPAVVTLAPADGTNIGVLALNSSSVFFVRSGNNISGIWSVPKTGGTASLVATTYWPSDVVADDQYVYWTNWSSIQRAPVSGGKAEQLYTGNNIIKLALDGANIYYTGWSYTTNGAIASILVGPTSGGTPTVLATGHPSSGALAVDTQHVYWTDKDWSNGNGSIRRVPKAGGTAETVVACGSCTPVVIRLDSANLYYRNNDGDVWSRAKSGGDLHFLSSGNTRSQNTWYVDLDVNASVAYWVLNDNSSQSHGLFRANADGSAWTAIDTAADTTWIGPRVDDTAIYYFHAGALLRRNK